MLLLFVDLLGFSGVFEEESEDEQEDESDTWIFQTRSKGFCCPVSAKITTSHGLIS
jgi:hypothetical protein